MEEEEFRAHLKAGVDKYARRTMTEEDWSRFASHLSFMTADLENPEVFVELARKLADQDREWNARANHIFYLGLPPGHDRAGGPGFGQGQAQPGSPAGPHRGGKALRPRPGLGPGP